MADRLFILLALIDSVPARLFRLSVLHLFGRPIRFSLADSTVPLMHIHLSGEFQDFRLCLFGKASRAGVCLPIQRLVPHKMTHYSSFGITSSLKLTVLSTKHPGTAPLLAPHHRLTNFKKESLPQCFVHKRRQRIDSESHIREKIWIRWRVAGKARRIAGKLSPQELSSFMGVQSRLRSPCCNGIFARKVYFTCKWRR